MIWLLLRVEIVARLLSAMLGISFDAWACWHDPYNAAPFQEEHRAACVLDVGQPTALEVWESWSGEIGFHIISSGEGVIWID